MTPFEQGYKDFLDGKPKDSNPFDDKSPWSANKWIDGWTKAQADRRSKR